MPAAGSVIQKRQHPHVVTTRRTTVALSVAVLVVAIVSGGCGSSSPGGTDGGTGSGGTGTTGGGGSGGTTGGSGGAGGGSAGAVTFSCYVANEFCTQLLVQPSGVSAEQQQCTTLQSGTSGTGCPTAGIIGCCQPKASDASHEEQCYYDPSEVSVAMGLCMTTWTTTM